MDADFEAQYHQLERSHWWFSARRDLIARLLSREPRSARILEIGCSSGALLELMASQGLDGEGIDVSLAAVEECRRRGLRAGVADGASLEFADDEFDVVIASDVLEHIADDSQALREWHRVLKPGGRLYVFVPAHQWLWSAHDEVNHHFRRYSRRELTARLDDAGFAISRLDSWNAALLPPIALVRGLQRMVRRQGAPRRHNLARSGGFVNRVLLSVLQFENRWLCACLPLPAGVSLFAIAAKPVPAARPLAAAAEGVRS